MYSEAERSEVSIPNSDGKKTFTPADMAESTRDFWRVKASPGTMLEVVLMTAS